MHPLASSWLAYLAKLLLSLGILAAVLWQAPTETLWATLAASRWPLVLLAGAVVIAGVIVLQAWEIQRSLPLTQRPPVHRLARINLAMMFYSFFLPTALTFGVRWAKYRGLGLDAWQSAALVGLHKLLQLLVACSAFFAAFYLAGLRLPGNLDTLLWLVAGCFLVVLGYVLLLAGGWRVALRLPQPPSAAGEGPGGRLLRRGLNMLSRLAGAMLAFGQLPAREKLLCLTFAGLQHICIVVSAYLAMLAVAPDTPWLAVVVIRSLLVVLLTLPVSVAGIGVRELVFFSLFPFYGVSAEEALAGSLLLLGIQLGIALLGAASEIQQSLWGWWRHRKMKGETP